MIWLTAAFAADCIPTTISELAAVPAPAVFVLGERKGTQPDLGRASRLVARLRQNGPITVGLQAIQRDMQPTLDRYANGQIPTESLADGLDWAERYGFPYPPYERLVTGAVHEDRVVALGLRLTEKPPSSVSPRPPGYVQVLSDAMAGHPLPPDHETEFLQTITWLDHTLAKEAVENWSGEGYLVIVVDLLQVEGGKGVGWQVQRLVDAPVHAVNLGGPGACYPGDKHL